MDYHVWGVMLEAYHKFHPKPKSITELKEVSLGNRSTRLLKVSYCD